MYYVNENIRDLYRVKCTDDRSKVIRLDMNENPIGLPASFVSEVKDKITAELIATYPMKEDLSRLIAEHNGIEKCNITITAGSEEAMRLVFHCFAQEDKELLSVIPTFEMYDVYSKMFGMKHVTVDYDDNFTLNTKDICNKISENTGIVVLLNPNSPIGTVYSDEEFESIIYKAKENDAVVVVDEAYHYFYENTQIDLINKYDNLIVLRTFSKLCSLAGLRIGYAVANKQLIEYLEKSESTFNVSTISILFASEILKEKGLIERLVEIEREGHQWFENQLTEAGYRLISGKGNYVLFYPRIDSSLLVERMKNNGVWIRDYGRGILKGWIRVSTADKETMKKAWNEIKNCDR